MKPKVFKETIDIGIGRSITIETGKLANRHMDLLLSKWENVCYYVLSYLTTKVQM